MILIVFLDMLYVHHPGLELKPDRIVLIEDTFNFGDHRYSPLTVDFTSVTI